MKKIKSLFSKLVVKIKGLFVSLKNMLDTKEGQKN